MKLQLKVQSGSLSGLQLELEKDAVLLGRSPGCALQFDFDKDHGVSKHHAKLEARPDGFYVVDLHSKNGTFINGQMIGERMLQSGDIIRLSNNGPEILVTMDPV